MQGNWSVWWEVFGGSLRPTVKQHHASGPGPRGQAWFCWAEGLGGRPPALVRPGSLAGGGGRPRAAAGAARAVLHGVINLLTQGWAGTPWRVTRCLAYCQLTNPLTRPEHALLTPRSRTLLTLQLQGLERGWDVGADEAPAVPAHGPGSLCRPTFRGRAPAIGLTRRPLPAGRP